MVLVSYVLPSALHLGLKPIQLLKDALSRESDKNNHRPEIPISLEI